MLGPPGKQSQLRTVPLSVTHQMSGRVALQMSTFPAVRVEDHAKHGVLLENRHGAGDGEEDHLVASGRNHRPHERTRVQPVCPRLSARISGLDNVLSWLSHRVICVAILSSSGASLPGKVPFSRMLVQTLRLFCSQSRASRHDSARFGSVTLALDATAM